MRRACLLHLSSWSLALALAACGARGEPSAEPIEPHKQPLQQELTADGPTLEAPRDRNAVHFTPRARYRIAARVLSHERYYWGWESKVAPVDLALGWGEMSDPSVDRWIDWRQGGRWYFWQWNADSPYGNDAIRADSANVHIVPNTPNLERALLALDRNDVIRMEGWLVDLQGPDGESRSTSLSRTDIGGNSCEILYVVRLTVDGKTYR